MEPRSVFRRRLRWGVLGTASLVALMGAVFPFAGAGPAQAFTASSASAVSPHAAAPTLVVSPSRAHPQQLVTVTGSGFVSGTKVKVLFDHAPVGTATANSGGMFMAQFDVPASALPGPHTVAATGGGRAASAPLAVHTDWAQRGFDPLNDNFNPYENVLGVSNVAQLHQQWSAVGSDQYPDSGVAVVDGTVYADLNGTDNTLTAFDQRTGAIEWTFPLANISYTVPAVDDGQVFVEDGSGTLYSIDATTHQPTWTANTGDGYFTSLAVSGGVVYVGGEAGLSAYDEATGAQLWAQTAYQYTGQFTLDPAAHTIIAADGQDHVDALDTDNGSVRWTRDLGIQGQGLVSAANGVVYISLGYELQARSESRGHLKWRAPDLSNRSFYGPTAVANGVLYVPDSSGGIDAFNARTGAKEWTGGRPSEDISAAPTVANGVVYESYGDRIAALEASNGTTLATRTVGGAPQNVAVVDGKVYVGSAAGPIALNLN